MKASSTWTGNAVYLLSLIIYLSIPFIFIQLLYLPPLFCMSMTFVAGLTSTLLLGMRYKVTNRYFLIIILGAIFFTIVLPIIHMFLTGFIISNKNIIGSITTGFASVLLLLVFPLPYLVIGFVAGSPVGIWVALTLLFMKNVPLWNKLFKNKLSPYLVGILVAGSIGIFCHVVISFQASQKTAYINSLLTTPPTITACNTFVRSMKNAEHIFRSLLPILFTGILYTRLIWRMLIPNNTLNSSPKNGANQFGR